MTIEHTFENDISKISVPEGVKLDADTLAAHQKLMTEFNGCLSFGPLKICYTIDLPKAVISLSVFGVSIGTMVLDPSKPCQRITINLYLVNGYVELCMKDGCLILNGQVCKFGSCTDWKNVKVFCWD